MNALVPQRSLGPSGLEVSSLALGSWNTWDRAEFSAVVENLRLATEAGVAFFDIGLYGYSLDTPSDHDTDIVLARAIREIGLPRERYRIAAKGWLPQTFQRDIAPLATQLGAITERHGTDYADVLVLGDVMVNPESYLPILTQIKELIDAGKALTWAVNNWSTAEIARATEEAAGIGLQAPEYAQLKYGLTRRSIAEGAPFAGLHAAQGITVQASEPFEGGLIFGRREGAGSRIIGGNIGGVHDRIEQSVDRIRQVAASLGATPSQLAIALPLTNPHTSSVLIGSRTPEQTSDNLGAFELLTRHSAAEIREACAEFWFDRDTVSPDASWGTSLGDDPSNYFVLDRASGEKPNFG